MYGSFLSFSDVSTPGVGGGINAGNAISSEQLAKQNQSGKKWRPNADGLMSNHNENILKMHSEHRENRASLVNREYNENCGGKDAMKEIFDRKKSRMSSFKEMKKNEYGFAEGDSQDSELLSMPLPAFKECACGGTCPVCREKKRKDAEFREWSTEKRKALEEGKVKGSFAGPDQSFPIASPVDVAAAWSSVGRAANPRQIMSNILKIAAKHGWQEGLPQSVKDRIKSGESGLPS